MGSLEHLLQAGSERMLRPTQCFETACRAPTQGVNRARGRIAPGKALPQQEGRCGEGILLEVGHSPFRKGG